MNKVLLVINHDAFGRQMARWARVLKHQGEWEPIIYISAGYMWRHVTACRAEGITVLSPGLDPPPADAGTENAGHVTSNVQQKLKDILRQVPGLRRFVNVCRRLVSPFRVISMIASLSRQLRLVRNLIRRHQIDVVMISESSPVYGAPVYMQAAHREGVPVVTAPIEKSTARHYAENYLYDSSLSLKRPINKVIGMIFPRWVLSHKGFTLVRVVPELLVALELLQLAPPNPWWLIGNQEDAVAVDSKSTFDHYAAEGVKPEQMVVIGRSEYTIMSQVLQDTERLKIELYKHLGLQINRPMVLSPLVPDHYISGRPECDFQDYDKLVEFWVKSLGAIEGYNIVISLHPGHTYQQDPHAWDYIEQWGVKICREDLASLVPLCDIYVATGFSTTAQWAIACGKPVVNYDVYRYRLPIYQSTPGVLDVQEQQDFLDALKRLTNEPVYYEEIAARQAACAEQWGLMDGKDGERLVKLFDQLMDRYGKR